MRRFLKWRHGGNITSFLNDLSVIRSGFWKHLKLLAWTPPVTIIMSSQHDWIVFPKSFLWDCERTHLSEYWSAEITHGLFKHQPSTLMRPDLRLKGLNASWTERLTCYWPTSQGEESLEKSSTWEPVMQQAGNEEDKESVSFLVSLNLSAGKWKALWGPAVPLKLTWLWLFKE